MKNLRTMSFELSQKISREELEEVSGAVCQTNSWTANGSYQNGHFDGCMDVTVDF